MAFFVGDPSAPTRFGTDVADTSDETGLFLKIFGGEVFAAFTETVITLDKHFNPERQVRSVPQDVEGLFGVPHCWRRDVGPDHGRDRARHLH
jgi:hypothetical protein